MVSPTLDEKLGHEELPVGWPWRFFLFSLLVGITTGVVYVGLVFGYTPFLNTRISEQQDALEQLGRVIPQKQQQEFVAFYSQLANLQTVLQNHIIASRLFGLLESRTSGLVFYTVMEARVPERKVLLEGSAASYAAFAQQLQSFTIAPEVENVIVNDSSALDGRVKFRLSLALKSSFFKP